MKKIIWVYGTIAGVIMGAMFFITAPLWDNGTLNMDNGMVVGYTTMVIALSMVFFGVKSYRDNHQNGVITFGHAFKVGILITVVASLLYALSWEAAYHTVSKGFSEEWTKSYVEKMKAKATNEAEVQAAIAEAENNKAMYENPLFRFPITLMEVFPVGLIMALITAGLLRKKEFLPDQQSN
jgi:Protein of unknown function (DUF4199)